MKPWKIKGVIVIPPNKVSNHSCRLIGSDSTAQPLYLLSRSPCQLWMYKSSPRCYNVLPYELTEVEGPIRYKPFLAPVQRPAPAYPTQHVRYQAGWIYIFFVLQGLFSFLLLTEKELIVQSTLQKIRAQNKPLYHAHSPFVVLETLSGIWRFALMKHFSAQSWNAFKPYLLCVIGKNYQSRRMLHNTSETRIRCLCTSTIYLLHPWWSPKLPKLIKVNW